MSRNKSLAKKRALARHMAQNRRVPIFVIAKTKRKVSRNRMQRNWRSRKLKLKVE